LSPFSWQKKPPSAHYDRGCESRYFLRINGHPPASLSSLQLSPNSSSIASGATQNFTATGTFSDGSTSDMTVSVQWSSSDSTVATVGSTGVANGLGIGVVVIT